MVTKKKARKSPPGTKAAAKPRSKAAAKAKSSVPKRILPSEGARGADAFDFWYRDRIALHVGRLAGQIYARFRLPTKASVAAAAEVLDTWLAAAGPEHFNWWRRLDREVSQPLDARSLTQIRRYVAETVKDDRGVRLMESATDREPQVLAESRTRELEAQLHPRGSVGFSVMTSFVRLVARPADMQNDPASWRNLLVRACDRLPVTSGAGGYLLATGLAGDREVRDAMEAALLRHPTLDFEDTPIRPINWIGAFRVPGWLTVLGETELGAVGPVGKLRSALPREVAIHEAEHGVVLEIGTRPTLEDAVLPLYREVYRVVQPLQKPVLRVVDPTTARLLTRLAP